MGEWIRVEDRLPEEDGAYLVSDGSNVVTAFLYLKGVCGDLDTPEWVDPIEEYYRYDVTHWMPLPEPPEEG